MGRNGRLTHRRPSETGFQPVSDGRRWISRPFPHQPVSDGRRWVSHPFPHPASRVVGLLQGSSRVVVCISPATGRFLRRQSVISAE
ncbi:hypothetical protein LINGRAHAP2_LOCUS23721 [Linum grandiflorum]